MTQAQRSWCSVSWEGDKYALLLVTFWSRLGASVADTEPSVLDQVAADAHVDLFFI